MQDGGEGRGSPAGWGGSLDCIDPSGARFSLQVTLDMERIMEFFFSFSNEKAGRKPGPRFRVIPNCVKVTAREWWEIFLLSKKKGGEKKEAFVAWLEAWIWWIYSKCSCFNSWLVCSCDVRWSFNGLLTEFVKTTVFLYPYFTNMKSFLFLLSQLLKKGPFWFGHISLASLHHEFKFKNNL